MQNEIQSLETQIADRKRELNDLKDIQQQVEEFKAKNKVLEDKISVMSSLEAGRDWFIRIVDHIGMSIPDDVWITGMDLGGKGRGGRSGGGKGIYSKPIKVVGQAYEKDAIGYFISNLESNKTYVKNVNLGKIIQKRAVRSMAESYTYDLTVNIKPPPKAE